ncbi:T9SS type A sorting domain-containing protein [Polluticoccus soli]|uniref:T9SS type A sorting domain-containing protein n=1 Tax=Polluticoccus soli TaxID=3034150 RepID=UPI0023E20E2C|nr:T9SS type A sorting domain-containing protein [Flavipsychrobacter sp. JY13-12]
MKALLLLAVSLPLFINAQTIHNNSFENWYIVNYNVLANWMTSNEITIPQYGAPNVTKISPGVTNSSLRLATIAVGLDTMIGFITNAAGLTTGEGGMPYSQRPTGLQGDFRYNIAPHDTARILVSFKHSGVVFATDMISIWGAQQSFGQKNFSLPVMTASGLTPDSVVIAITSGDFLNSPAANSYIEIDNLVFTGSNLTQGINGDFDNWLLESFVDLNDWAPTGSVFQTSDAFSGNYAAKLMSKNNGVVIEAASIKQNFVPSKTIDTLIGWYKYTSKTPDSASVEVNMVGIGGPSAIITKFLPAVAGYTQFKIPLVGANSSTVKATILIGSSRLSPLMGDSSTLYLDSLVIKPQVVEVKEVANNTSVHVYPNPVKDVLTIAMDDDLETKAAVAVYNSTGTKVYLGMAIIQGGRAAIPVKQLATGMYIYEVKLDEAEYKGRFMKE